MNRTLTIPDTLYTRLEDLARTRGFSRIEQLLDAWQSYEDTLRQRRLAVAQIDALGQRLSKTYGTFLDSAADIREDRTR